MAAGELSTRMMMLPSSTEAAAVSGRSENLNLGKGFEPFVGVKALGQALLVHGQGVHLQVLNPLLIISSKGWSTRFCM